MIKVTVIIIITKMEKSILKTQNLQHKSEWLFHQRFTNSTGQEKTNTHNTLYKD